MSAFFVELFPTSARYTGFSLGYQFATVFTGAVAPLIGVALLNAYGSTLPVSLYAAAMTGPGLVCLGLARRDRRTRSGSGRRPGSTGLGGVADDRSEHRAITDAAHRLQCVPGTDRGETLAE